MATQGFTTGGKSILMLAPVAVSSQGIEVAQPRANLPTSIMDFAGKYDATNFLELTVFSSRDDEVGIISTAPALDASPKTISFTIDRDDNFALRFMQRYCTSLRLSYENPASTATSTTAKEYEDGLSVRGESTSEETDILPLDTVFFAWLGPSFRDTLGGTKIIYGLAGVSSTSANFTTAFQTDNQFTFTLTGAPQDVDAEIDLSDYIFNSAVGANFGTVGGAGGVNNLPTAITNGKIATVFGQTVFTIPSRTSIIVDKAS
jgi:hypothetical protein